MSSFSTADGEPLDTLYVIILPHSVQYKALQA